MRVTSISDLPRIPAVYAMRSGYGNTCYVAYVGMADDLKRRIYQHLVRRDSSVVTGVSAVSLNPDLVSEVQWWGRSEFTNRTWLGAAELLAFDLLEPVMRSRGNVSQESEKLYESMEFRMEMGTQFIDEPDGVLVLPSMKTLIEEVSTLHQRIAALEDSIVIAK
jgi:hypothetical protein